MPLKISPSQVAFNARGDGTFNQQFKEQVDFFRQKLNLPTERYDDILKSAHDKAVVVAGAVKADLLADFNSAIDQAISQGKGIKWFKNEFENIVQKHGWEGWTGSDTLPGRDWRARVIYNTNIQTSYNAGRYAQLTDPDLLKSRPYWEYLHDDRVAHPRPIHESWNHTVLRYDDSWWQTHFTPNGWGCHCRVTAVRASRYKGLPAPDDGTYTHTDSKGDVHVLPKGVDYGWDYAPGASIRQSLQPFIDTKIANLPKPLAAALKADVASIKDSTSLVSQVLKLPKSGVAKKSGDHVIPIIDKLHSVEFLPPIPVINSKSGKFQGQYGFYINSGNAIDIKVSTASRHPPLTLAHEIGHFIDHQSINEKGKYASATSPLFEKWRQAIDASAATNFLKNTLTDPLHKRLSTYYLSRHEQWARSYAQWVAERSGDKLLLEQVSKIEAATSSIVGSSQWDALDFEPIALAIDAIFKELGWLK